jgi:hypothetical protein
MKTKSILGLLMFIVIVSPLTAQIQMPNEMIIYGSGDGENMYQWAVSADRLSAQPQWTPSSDTLPLPVNKAVEIAEGWIKSKTPEIKSLSVSSIEIAGPELLPSVSQDRWYYKISFLPIIGGQRMRAARGMAVFTAVVLFDGTVVEPRIQKMTQGFPGMGTISK